MRRAAFTLLEMMLVVAVIAILMLVLVGSMDDLTPWAKVSSAAREVAAAVRFVASEAGATGRTHWLTYDLENDMHWVVLPRTEEEEKEFGEGGFATRVREDDTARRTLHRDLPDGVVFVDVVNGDEKRTYGELKFEFGPLGFAPAHAVHIRYREDDELSMTVSVNPVTAEPEILEGLKNPTYISDVPR